GFPAAAACSTCEPDFAPRTVVVNEVAHGLATRPGRQSQTVPYRSRGFVIAGAWAAGAGLALPPPHPARTTPSTRSGTASFSESAWRRIEHAQSTLGGRQPGQLVG